MGQPKRNSAEYFTHDADMRNDIKVKALRRRFGHKGYAVWCFILETLTDSDNFEAEYDTVSKELLAADFDLSVEELTEMVNYCIRLGLLQVSGNHLFSDAHKRRFAQINERKQAFSEAGKRGMKTRWGQRQEDKEVIASDNLLITTDKEVITSDNKENRREENKNRIEYPYQDIFSLWNELCGTLPKVKRLTDERRLKIKLRLAESGAKTEVEMKAWAKALFTRCAASPFLCGQNGNNWTATFDWLFDNGKNWVKVSEGNYDDRGSNGSGVFTGRTGVANALGVGEYLTQDGRRTYGSGQANIPLSAPPRPGSSYSWDAQSNSWIVQ